MIKSVDSDSIPVHQVYGNSHEFITLLVCRSLAWQWPPLPWPLLPMLASARIPSTTTAVRRSSELSEGGWMETGPCHLMLVQLLSKDRCGLVLTLTGITTVGPY